MSANRVLDPIREHGTFLDRQNKRVRCNYCGKEVQSFYRLMFHLAGVRINVSPCEKVCADLREQFRDAVREELLQKVDEKPEPVRTKIHKSVEQIHKSTEPPSVWSNVDGTMPTTNNIFERLKEVNSSLQDTGCSILLNGWTSEKGKDLLIFLVDCPQGTIYLKSVDVSDCIRDVDALFSLFDGVVLEIGIENVVQVVVYDNSSSYIEAAGKKLVEKHQSIFWTPCAAHCVNLMLDDIGKIDHVRKILDKAIDIITFLDNHPQLTKLVKMQTEGMEMINESRSDMLFLMLEKIVSKQGSLKSIFSFSESNTSIWASTNGADRVTDMVWDPSFWAGANEVLNTTIPLIHLLSLIDDDDKRPMGYIYDGIDKAKETIRENLGGDKAKYIPIWTIIDAIWNKQLHSPLHSTAYMLNPAILYSSQYYADSEVSSGLICCIERMVPDLITQSFLFSQLDEYKDGEGGFASKTAIKQRTTTPPDEWWLTIGGHCPQLQRFAVRILSQTCSSRARKCELIKDLIEKFHAAEGGSKRRHERLHDKVFSDANALLLDSQSVGDRKRRSNSFEEIVATKKGRKSNTYLPEASDSKRDLMFFDDAEATKDDWTGCAGVPMDSQSVGDRKRRSNSFEEIVATKKGRKSNTYLPEASDSKRDSMFFDDAEVTKDDWTGCAGVPIVRDGERDPGLGEEIEATKDDQNGRADLTSVGSSERDKEIGAAKDDPDSDEDVRNDVPTIIDLDDGSGLENVEVAKENSKINTVIELDDSDSS